MEVDGWAEWAGAAPESPPEASPTLIGPLEVELGELPELVVTWAARLAGTEDALLWLVEPERQRLLRAPAAASIAVKGWLVRRGRPARRWP